MSRAIQVAVLTCTVSVVGILVEATHHATNEKNLSQTAVRITEATRHANEGRLRASESLLFQVDIDLAVIERETWWARQTAITEARRLRTEHSAAVEALGKKADTSCMWIQKLAELLVQPDILPAREFVETTQGGMSNFENTLSTLSQVVNHVMAIQFDDATQSLAALTQNLPSTNETTQQIALLRSCIQRKRVSYPAFLRETTQRVVQHLRGNEIAAAKSVIVAAQAQFASANPTVTAIADFTACLEKSDFARAKSILATIATPCVDPRDKQALVAALTESVEFACNRSNGSFAEVTSAIERFLSEGKYAEARMYLERTGEHRDVPKEVKRLLSQFVDHFTKHDFARMDRTLESFEKILPKGVDAIAVLQPLKDVSATVKHTSQQAMREESERLAKVIRDAIEHARNGQIERSRELLEGMHSPSNRTAITNLSTFLTRIEVQDFSGARTYLELLPKTLVDGEDLRGLAAAVLTDEMAANKNKQASIAKQIKTIVQNPSNSRQSPASIKLRGRAMVWDFTKNDVEKTYELLPDDLRASSRDGIITMFCILKREDIQVGTYSISGKPGYRERMQVAVVFWPSKQYGGESIILGPEPPGFRIVSNQPEYGSSVKIKEWIERLPRDRVPAIRTAAPNPGHVKAATALLLAAKSLLDANRPASKTAANAKLREIIKKYPETEAASEAIDLLNRGG